jgi:hypothetical protein
MSIIKKSKKLSSMTPEEMLAEAKVSPTDATRVAQYLYSIGNTGSSWDTWELLAKDESTKINPDVMVFMVRSIDTKGPSTKTYSILVSLLNGQPNDDPRLSSELTSLASKRKDSDFAPILMLMSGTPYSVINRIANENGLGAKMDFNQATSRHILVSRMAAISRDIRWENEQSGTIIGTRIMASKDDAIAKMMLENSISFPSSFIHAVFEYGSDYMVETITNSMGENISVRDAKELFKRLADPAKGEEISDKIMNNLSLPVWQRLEFAQFLRGWTMVDAVPWIKHVYEKVRNNNIYPSDEPALFEMAVEDFEKGLPLTNLDKIVGNIDMALTYSDRIIAAAKKRDLKDHLGHALTALMTLSGEDDEF